MKAVYTRKDMALLTFLPNMQHAATLRRILILGITCAIFISGCSTPAAIAPTTSAPTLATIAATAAPINTAAATAAVAPTNTVAPSPTVPAATNTAAVTATLVAPTSTILPTQPPVPTIAPTTAITPTVAAGSSTSAKAVTIEGLHFTPQDLTVPVGTTVQWTNKDIAMHTVTSGFPGEPDGIFDAGVLKQNAQYSVTFDKAGEYKYYCQIHPFMHGTVVVSAP